MPRTSLLAPIVSRHSPIVIGYAGWEGDVIMTALKRRLQSGLPNNLYWFAHRRSDLERLRSLLKDHRDLCLVLPDKPTKAATEPPPASEEKLAGAAGEAEPTLTAQSVLDKLVAVFTTKSPALTLDPVGFFAEQLKNSFPQDSPDKPSDDIYELRDVIRRVELVRTTTEAKPTAIEAETERVRDAVRRSLYLEALAIARQIDPNRLSPVQREALIESAMSAALGLNDNSQAELDGYDLVLRLATGKVAERPTFGRRVALALFRKGVTLGHLNRSEEAIAVYDEVVRRFGDAPEPAVREQVAKALFTKGVVLDRLNRSEEAIAVYDEVLRGFGDATEPAVREQVAKALFNRGGTLVRLNRSEEAIAAYDEVLRRFGDAPEPAVREQVTKALFNKGLTLGQLNRSEEEIAAYDELLRRFGDSPESTLREQAAKALVNKGVTLGQLNRK